MQGVSGAASNATDDKYRAKANKLMRTQDKENWDHKETLDRC